MAAYLAEHGSATFEELGERFGLSPKRVAVELERATLCEIPPFTGSSLFDLVIDDAGVVAVDIPAFLRRPPRLTTKEGFAVLAAGRAMLALDPDQPALRAALDKLGTAMALHADAVEFDVETPAQVELLEEAVNERRRLEVTYYTASRDDLNVRRIDPLIVHLTDGRWYVDAFDHASGEVRKFRADRIEQLRDTGETFQRGEVDLVPTAYAAGATARRVRVRLPAEAEWVAETYPVSDRADHPDGSFEVSLDVVGTVWLERLLLRVGAAATVLEPPDLVGLGPAAADRLLRLYR